MHIGQKGGGLIHKTVTNSNFITQPPEGGVEDSNAQPEARAAQAVAWETLAAVKHERKPFYFT